MSESVPLHSCTAHSHLTDSFRVAVLSVVVLFGGSRYENNVEESVVQAKQAVALDVKDGESWYVLGNAYLCKFFVPPHEPKELKRALTAYESAEKNATEAMAAPDLFFNRANVHKYLQECVP